MTLRATDERAEVYLHGLIGSQLRRVNRAASIGQLGFGDDVKVTQGPLGRARMVTRMAFHIQCAWRIVSPDRVLLGSADIGLRPADAGLAAGDGPERTLFDLRAAEIEASGSVATHVALTWAGGLIISLSGGRRIEIVPDDSLGEEMWRFFTPGGPHLVISGNGVEWRE